ncbi:MAG: hypothetical protein IKH84_03895, partial [Ottowia sp.]|nr:hypothetical protein [Ottowia sp.]
MERMAQPIWWSIGWLPAGIAGDMVEISAVYVGAQFIAPALPFMSHKGRDESRPYDVVFVLNRYCIIAGLI